jgi:hypothetical protein
VPQFAFDIADVVDLGDDHEGITLVGPPIDASGGLEIGDTLLVPTVEGDHTPCECVGFPLVDLGPERASWVRVSVGGVMLDEVLVGARATRQA